MGEVSTDIIQKTQKSLGKYVKKPALTEKLLKKPPFRFLHDITKVLIKENGFLKGLFSEEELNSENVKEKDAKVAFLTKLIDATKTISKTEIKAKPSKIVAGLEPIDTNILLQTIAKILDNKIDTQDYVKKFKSGELKSTNNIKKSTDKESVKKSTSKHNLNNKTDDKPNKEIKKEKIIKQPSKEKIDTRKPRDSSVTRVKKSGSVETPKSSERLRESSRAKKDINEKSQSKEKVKNGSKENIKENDDKAKIVDEKVKTSINEANINQNTNSENNLVKTDEIINNGEQTKDEVDKNSHIIDEKPSENDKKSTENTEKPTEKFQNFRQPSAGLLRPKSARPKSGERDRVTSSRIGKSEMNRNSEVVEIKATVPPARPKSSLRPPSVRPSSARPGAPRLRPESALAVSEPVLMGNINVIVENFDPSGGDDEETVVIQNSSELVEDEGPTAQDLLNMSTENKGQLVEQILEQIQEGTEGDGVKKKVDIDWEQDGLRGKDATTKEVTQLRALIQNLTKTANPLGKLMNYLHEDLDAMHSELQMWTNTKRQLYVEIEKQKKINAETSKPLLSKLERLKADIKKIEEEISTSRSNILKNEQRISELLSKQ